MRKKRRYDPSEGPLPVPRCFVSEQQFLSWVSTAMCADPGDSEFCADCTPEFQRERIRDFRCAHPGTTFHIGVDGFYEGVRPLVRLPNQPPPSIGRAREEKT